MEISAMCQAALDLFRRGFCPIPIIPSTKHPACRWDPWKQDLDEEKIRHHFERHAEHWLGVLTEGGLFVIDADTPEGVAALHQLSDSLDISPGIIVQTRRGEHHYYRLADGVFAKSATPDTKQFPARCDIKTGRALVIVPPSPGKSVEIDEIDHFNDLQALAQNQVDAIFRHNGQEPPREHMAPTPGSVHELPAFGEPSAAFFHAIPRVKALLSAIDADCGYQDWFRVCAALYSESNGSEEAFVLFDEWSSRGSKYPGRAEIMRQWGHCRRYVGGRVSLATVAHIARNNGADLSAIARQFLDSPDPADRTITAAELSEASQTSDSVQNREPVPLAQFSLRGNSEIMRADLKNHVFFIDGLASVGQLTVWFGKPNSGKTLLAMHGCIEAIAAKRVDADNVYYVNADDSFSGLTNKVELAEEHGFHVLAPGHHDFRPEMLLRLLRTMAAKDQARDIVVVLDTLKKFTSLMDKTAAREFGTASREFVLKGGTILALSHTNKNRGDDGRLVPAGTSDFVDDADCAFVIDHLNETDDCRTVRFENIKSRGPADRVAAFLYSIADDDQSYIALLESVERIPKADIAKLQADVFAQAEHPEELVNAIIEHIQRGRTSKQTLIEAVAIGTQHGQKKVRATIDALQGTDPTRHRWTVTKGERGLQT
ncbi:MAG: PriCT-2 domain-containing protein, partial [Chromatocurvus sp.]